MLKNDLSSLEYAITELSKDGQRRIYINSKFYGRSFQDITDIIKRRHCRFTLAHELGHCFIPAHADYLTQQLMLDKSNLHAKKYSFTKEYEANTFASENPQLLALILAYLRPELAAQVLSFLNNLILLKLVS